MFSMLQISSHYTDYAILVKFGRHLGVDHRFEATEETWWYDASSCNYLQMPELPVIQEKLYSAVIQPKGSVQWSRDLGDSRPSSHPIYSSLSLITPVAQP